MHNRTAKTQNKLCKVLQNSLNPIQVSRKNSTQKFKWTLI